MVYTLNYTAKLQLHARLEPTWDVDRSKALNAAVSAARLLQTINVGHLKFVDPLMGVSVTCLVVVLSIPSHRYFSMFPAAFLLPHHNRRTVADGSFLSFLLIDAMGPYRSDAIRRPRQAEAACQVHYAALCDRLTSRDNGDDLPYQRPGCHGRFTRELCIHWYVPEAPPLLHV